MFHLALTHGLEADPVAALERTVAAIEAAKDRDGEPGTVLPRGRIADLGLGPGRDVVGRAEHVRHAPVVADVDVSTQAPGHQAAGARTSETRDRSGATTIGRPMAAPMVSTRTGVLRSMKLATTMPGSSPAWTP